MSWADWALVVVLFVLVCGVLAFLIVFGRQAYIGGRYIDACGGIGPAARHLASIEADNEARLAGALSIHAFTKDKKP